MSLINIEKTITLDVYDHDTTPAVIKTIQMDTGTRTVFAMLQNSRQDYDIGQNATVSLTVLRPDKTKVQITGQTFISYTGADGTIYGAKAELSDVALAVKGNLKAQFKITSGDQELRTEIFTISNGEALDAGDGDWAGDLDGHNLDEMAQDIEDTKAAVSEMETDVSELKSGLNGMTTATAEDVGKALKAKTVTDGKVTEWEFGEAGGADPEAIEQAVSDWLDEHPEATTTVEDGSLTEVKLSDALKKATVKEYVTPEMFGAVGDGTTDDTQAIRSMLATDAKYYVFAKSKYKITDSIDFTRDFSIIVFNQTQIIVDHKNDLVEYAVGFKAAFIKTLGLLRVTVARHAYIGIWLQGVHGSAFDDVIVEGAIIWGLYMYDKSGGGNNTVSFNNFRAGSCGITYFAKGKYISNTELAITDIDYSGYSQLTDAQKQIVFGGDYRQITTIIDDSGYGEDTLSNRLVYCSRLDQPITLDSSDLTKGTFNRGTSAPNIRSDYSDGDNGRRIAILIGGGAKFGSSASEGGLHLRRASINSCSVAMDMGFPYGAYIDMFMCESCTVLIASRYTIWYMYIGYLYVEAIGHIFSNTSRRSIYLITQDSNTKVMVGTCSEAYFSASSIVTLVSQTPLKTGRHPMFLVSNEIPKVSGVNISADQFFGYTITEKTTRSITYNASALSVVDTATPFTLDIEDINNTMNGFTPVTIYLRNTNKNANAQKLRFGIKKHALDLGYSINGAVDNILIIDGANFGNNYKVTIILFGTVFYITAEPLTYIDNTVTE